MSRPKLVLVDGSSIIYRAFFALPPLTTADGTPTNAVYGFTAMLLKLLEDEQPEVMVLAFEGGRTFRHTEFTEYKGHRPRTPDELAVQGPIARAVADALRIPSLQHEGFEADDVLGTLAVRGEADGYQVAVVTGDLDALQLVSEHIHVLVNRRGTADTQRYDEAAVLERYGLPPRLLPDFKALKGDPSDNIPGIAGIGDKTAAALLQQYGSLEELLAHAGEVKAPKVRANLLAGKEDVLLYRRLATVVCNLPLETPWDAWRYRGPDLPRALELFERLEFRTLANRLRAHAGGLAEGPGAAAVAAAADTETPPLAWEETDAGPAVEGLCAAARSEGRVAVRCLQAGREGRGGCLRGMALSAGGHTVVVGPGTAPETGEGAWQVPAELAALLGEVGLAAHDAKREWHALAPAGIVPPRVAFDTLLAAYVLNPGRSTYRLEDLARELERRVAARAGTEAEEKGAAAHIAAQVAALYESALHRLREEGLERVYTELELPLVPLLARLEALGVAVDSTALRELSARLDGEIRRLEEAAHQAAGRPVNLGSPKQLQEVLFGELGLPTMRKTKTGYSTDSDTLQDLAVLHPLPALILEWREVTKLKSTYTDALQALIDPVDGRVHTRLNQAVAATGRLSSSDPNLQNIPVRTAAGREIRSAFVAAPGMELLSADYSQIELRLMAHVSQDPELVSAFRRRMDVHVATASLIFNVPPEEVTAEQRRRAKTVNFAVMYGQREFGLSRQLRIPVAEAKAMVEGYFARFPGVLGYVERTLSQARRYGYVTTLPPYERRRYIPGIHSANRNERLAAEREATNAPLQGTAADLIKLAMLRVDTAMTAAGLHSRMVLQVHDELLFEVAPGERDVLAELARREMEGVAQLSVPLEVDLAVGPNWRDQQPLPRPVS